MLKDYTSIAQVMLPVNRRTRFARFAGFAGFTRFA
jgi:hypothetical protein